MEKKVSLKSETLKKIFGTLDKNARIIEDVMQVRLIMQDGGLLIVGEACENVENAETLLKNLASLIGYGYEIDEARAQQSAYLAKEGKTDEIISLATDTIAITAKGKHVKCKTLGQRYYVKSIKKH